MRLRQTLLLRRGLPGRGLGQRHRALATTLGDVRVGLPPLGAPEPAEYAAADAAAAAAIDVAARLVAALAFSLGLGGVGRILGLRVLYYTVVVLQPEPPRRPRVLLII